jgi:hypothetical protein
MSNRSKHRTRSEMSDAARPDERMGQDLGDDLDVQEEGGSGTDALSASGSDDENSPLLAEGEPVGPWSEEDEEENAVDASSDESEEVLDENAPSGYQASPDAEPPELGRKRRRGH